MRCDLHVHSLRSGFTDLTLLRHVVYDCYSEPRAVYAAARRRGMDLVTLTDHDSIAGALELLHLPGTFVSEELTCHLPGERQMHLGVFGLDERRHAALQARRRDPEALFAYLAEERLPACLNHPFSPLTGPRVSADFDLVFGHVRLVETRNGMLPEQTNRYASLAARRLGHGRVGGSDAHALASVGCAYTEVRGARDVDEFLDGLRRGACVPRGSSATYARLARDLGAVALCGVRHAAAHAGDGLAGMLRAALAFALLPALPLLPLIAARLRARERLLAARFFHRWSGERGGLLGSLARLSEVGNEQRPGLRHAL